MTTRLVTGPEAELLTEMVQVAGDIEALARDPDKAAERWRLTGELRQMHDRLEAMRGLQCSARDGGSN